MPELTCIGFDDTLSVRNGLAVLPYRVLHIMGQETHFQIIGLAIGHQRFELHEKEPKTIPLDQSNDGLIAAARQVLAGALATFDLGDLLDVFIMEALIHEVPRMRARMERLIQVAQAALAE